MTVVTNCLYLQKRKLPRVISETEKENYARSFLSQDENDFCGSMQCLTPKRLRQFLNQSVDGKQPDSGRRLVPFVTDETLEQLASDPEYCVISVISEESVAIEKNPDQGENSNFSNTANDDGMNLSQQADFNLNEVFFKINKSLDEVIKKTYSVFSARKASGC